ncbi:MAG: hypothetical protein U1D00_14165, partial [Mycobacterium sp.]|nr:hypothetical protein [Mycobacterium sp.]
MTVISRAQWGAEESMRRATPVYDNGIRAGVIHHSATGNNYAPNESAAIVRSIYAYHTRTRGWGDVADPIQKRVGGVTRASGIADITMGEDARQRARDAPAEPGVWTTGG